MRAMRRACVLTLVVVVGALSAAIAAHQQPSDKPKIIEVEKLHDNLFVLRGTGGGGNTAVFITSTVAQTEAQLARLRANVEIVYNEIK